MSTKGLQLPRLDFQIRGLWSCLIPLASRIYHHAHVYVRRGKTPHRWKASSALPYWPVWVGINWNRRSFPGNMFSSSGVFNVVRTFRPLGSHCSIFELFYFFQVNLLMYPMKKWKPNYLVDSWICWASWQMLKEKLYYISVIKVPHPAMLKESMYNISSVGVLFFTHGSCFNIKSNTAEKLILLVCSC